MKKIKIPGVTFSWKRAVGITKIKQQIARETGIPMTKNGLERKIGRVILNTIFKKQILMCSQPKHQNDSTYIQHRITESF